jgi:hypothetical protein
VNMFFFLFLMMAADRKSMNNSSLLNCFLLVLVLTVNLFTDCDGTKQAM